MEAAVKLDASQPDNLIKYRVAENKSFAEVLLPGLNYVDFDKKIYGRWTYWSIAETFESIRFAVLFKGFLEYNRLKDNTHSAFLASSKAELSPIVHNIRGKTHWGMKFPIYCTLKLTHIGTSSFSYEIEMYEGQTGNQLATYMMRFVYVDMQTRKPASLPEWFMEFGKEESFRTGTKRTIDRPDKVLVPDNAFKYHTHATHSDIDFNGHVNHSVFVRWCADAGAEAVLNSSYKNFTKDIGLYPLKTMFVQYIGEALVNEDVVVKTWEGTNKARGDKKSPENEDLRTLHFYVGKDEKPIFIAVFVYYESDAAVARSAKL